MARTQPSRFQLIRYFITVLLPKLHCSEVSSMFSSAAKILCASLGMEKMAYDVEIHRTSTVNKGMSTWAMNERSVSLA